MLHSPTLLSPVPPLHWPVSPHTGPNSRMTAYIPRILVQNVRTIKDVFLTYDLFQSILPYHLSPPLKLKQTNPHLLTTTIFTSLRIDPNCNVLLALAFLCSAQRDTTNCTKNVLLKTHVSSHFIPHWSNRAKTMPVTVIL